MLGSALDRCATRSTEPLLQDDQEAQHNCLVACNNIQSILLT